MGEQYCIHCGQKLESDAIFCIACGSRVEPSAGESGGSVAVPGNAVGSVDDCEVTQRMSVAKAEDAGFSKESAMAGGSASGSFVQPVDPVIAANQKPRKKGLSPVALGVTVFLVALALIGGGAACFMLHPWDADAKSNETHKATVQQSATEESSSDKESTAPLGADVAKQEDDAAKAKISEADVKASLTVSYEKLSGYDEEIRACASDYNSTFVTSSLSSRKASLAACTELKGRIDASAVEARAIDVPSSSSYYQKHQDIKTLYDDLSARIGVIEESWIIDVRYENPADHVAEIEAPIVRDNDSDGKNKYFLDFQSRYPSARP